MRFGVSIYWPDLVEMVSRFLRLSVSDTKGEERIMPFVRKAALAVLGIVVTGLYLAVPAGADPGDNPCHSMFNPICRMVPIMPDLDHDIDVSQDPNGPPDGQSAFTQADTRQGAGSVPGVAPSGR